MRICIFFFRDERLEMFESADGRLSCYKRNSTSLSSRLGQKIVLETYKIKSNMFVIIKILI